VVNLGTLDGDPRSDAFAINNLGQVVGWSGEWPLQTSTTTGDPLGFGREPPSRGALAVFN
jgi:probable HAF family extracellular repeat protein